MDLDLKSRWEEFTGRHPRGGQWLMAVFVGIFVLGLMFAVIKAGKSDAPKADSLASGPTGDRTSVLAPGSAINEREEWMATAGRELRQYKEKERQRDSERAADRKLTEQLNARFESLEKRLTAPGQANAASSPADIQPPSGDRPQSPTARSGNVARQPLPPPTQFPPAGALNQSRGLPPPPPRPNGRGALPVGSPSNMAQGVTPVDPDQLAGPGGAIPSTRPPRPALVRVSLARSAAQAASAPGSDNSNKKVGGFLPVSITRGRLLSGLDAPTNGQAQDNPHPVYIQLEDNSILPNRFRADYKNCFVLGAGYGDLSTERAYIRTESLSCVKDDGTALEMRIEGNVFGEDGKYGVRGRPVTKQGKILLNGMIAATLSAIGHGLQANSTTTTTSALGSVATTNSGVDAYKAGLGAGLNKAFDRLAQYYVRLLEQTFPVLEVDAGRMIDVGLTKGIIINALHEGAEMVDPKPRASARYLNTEFDDE